MGTPNIMKKVQFSNLDTYGCDPMDKDDVYTIPGFVELCKQGGFIDDDGCGELVSKDKYVLTEHGLIWPSMIVDDYEFPLEAHYVVWYNK